jgi:hypothetical protein
MSCIVSISNGLSGGGVYTAGGGALPTAVGYQASWAIDGLMERPWRRGAAMTQHKIVVETSGVRPMNLIAAFDLRPLAPAVTATVDVYTSLEGRAGVFVKVGTLDQNARGDGALRLPGHMARSVRFDVTLSAAADCICGELWAGAASALPLAPVQVGRDVARATKRRESPGGSTWATKQAEPREVFVLPFPPMGEEFDAVFSTVLDAAEGDARPVVIVPDSDDLAGVYHGRLTGGDSRTMPADGYWRGRQIAFTESGRVLRG